VWVKSMMRTHTPSCKTVQKMEVNGRLLVRSASHADVVNMVVLVVLTTRCFVCVILRPMAGRAKFSRPRLSFLHIIFCHLSHFSFSRGCFCVCVALHCSVGNGDV